jgi:hypothetical protein
MLMLMLARVLALVRVFVLVLALVLALVRVLVWSNCRPNTSTTRLLRSKARPS